MFKLVALVSFANAGEVIKAEEWITSGTKCPADMLKKELTKYEFKETVVKWKFNTNTTINTFYAATFQECADYCQNENYFGWPWKNPPAEFWYNYNCHTFTFDDETCELFSAYTVDTKKQADPQARNGMCSQKAVNNSGLQEETAPTDIDVQSDLQEETAPTDIDVQSDTSTLLAVTEHQTGNDVQSENSAMSCGISVAALLMALCF